VYLVCDRPWRPGVAALCGLICPWRALLPSYLAEYCLRHGHIQERSRRVAPPAVKTTFRWPVTLQRTTRLQLSPAPRNPDALPSPILRRLSRLRSAAPRLAVRCCGILPPRAGGGTSAASEQRLPVEAGGGRKCRVDFLSSLLQLHHPRLTCAPFSLESQGKGRDHNAHRAGVRSIER
jgi:hypothetical protein